MSKINRFKAVLSKMLAAFGAVSTDKGILAWDGDEDLKAGDNVYIEDAEGNRTEAPDGDYITSDNKTVVVESGKVAEIRDPEAEVSPEEPIVEEARMIETDKGKLEWENEERDLRAGDAVYIRDEEGNRIPAPDGEYKTEDGKTIVVVDGKVAEIRDPEAEVAPETAEELRRLRRENASLRAQMVALTKKVDALSRMPAAKPAHEEVKTPAKVSKTGMKGLDRFSRYVDIAKK